MAQEPNRLQLVRQTLENVMPAKLAQTVLFESLTPALGDRGTLPESAAEFERFVREPLYRALRRRMSVEQAGVVVERLLVLLERESVRPAPPPQSLGVFEASTQSLRVRKGPVAVVVIANGTDFAWRLVAALGSDRVCTVPVQTREAIEGVAGVQQPGIVVVDASDPPLMGASHLAEALRQFPAPVPRFIWGTDVNYGRELLGHLRKAQVGCLGIDRKEGFHPLLDVVLSRQS